MWWRWLWLLVLLAVSPGLWAQPVEVALFEGGEGLEYFQRCAREMGQVQLYGDPRISEKLRIRLLEGHPPEVSNANLPYEQLIAKGKILPLESDLEGPNWDGTRPWKEDFLPGSLDRFRSPDGHIYAVPLPYTVQACYYSRSTFAREGWTPPTTWSEWLLLCQKVEKKGMAAIAFQGRYTYYASPLLHHLYYHLAGRQAYQDQLALKPGSFDNPAMVEALSKVQQLAREHFQPGCLGMSHTEAQLEFLSGRAAMLVCGSWFKSEMHDKIPPGFDLGEFPLPLPDQGSQDPTAVQVGAGYFFVFSESRNPRGGVDYLRYITSRSRARQLVQAQDLPVAVVGANELLSPDLAQLGEMLRQARSSFGEGMSATHPGMVQVWSDVRFALLHGQATPEELAHQLETGAAALLQEPPTLYPYRPWVLLTLMVVLWLAGGGRPLRTRLTSLQKLPWLDLMWLVGPPMALYLVFFLLPSLAALLAAGSQWDGLGAPSWVGGDNFRRLLTLSPHFWMALGNNLFLMAWIPTLITVWSLIFAVLLQPDRRRHQFLRALYFFPHLLGIGSILVWQQVYHPHGPLNRLLCNLGLTQFENFAWLSQEHLYPSMLILALWSATGFQLILTSAALTQVPQELYEAAQLEGASRWQQFRLVSWPFLKPTVLAGYFLLLISSVKSFETVWLLTNQEPTSEVHVLGTLLMQTAFAELRLGEASALAVILLVLVLALQRVLQRWESDNL